MGYKILQVHEVLHWQKSEVYDPVNKEGGLFTGYINTFLKLKQQSSGFPGHVKTNEEKDLYIEKYYDHEGIHLEKKLIQKKSRFKKFVQVSSKLILWQIWTKNQPEEDKIYH